MSEEGPPKLYTDKPRKVCGFGNSAIEAVSGATEIKRVLLAGGDGDTRRYSAATSATAKGTLYSALQIRLAYAFGCESWCRSTISVSEDESGEPVRSYWTDDCLNSVAYLFTRTKKKGTGEEEQDVTRVSTKDATPHVVEMPVPPPSITNPMIKREPIPENEQCELLKWILEEKRKVKAKDAEEKRKIDEEKALLKKLIRSKSIPSV
ncbi:hypothetical protein JHK86_017265 [Glycine max]|nr:hypothetical protein JHK86_017265 [Glycine max]